MAGIVLSVEQREQTGTGASRTTRNNGLLPGVLYGGPRGAVPISLKFVEVDRALRSGKFIAHMVEIDHRGERQPVIPRDIQFHPVTDAPIHVDLYRVEENSVITVDVPLHFINHEASPGLKRGGALNIVRHTVNLRVKANAIPEAITIDLSGLNIGDVVHISSVALPDGARPTIRDRDFTLATIAGRGGKADAEDEATETAASEDAPKAP